LGVNLSFYVAILRERTLSEREANQILRSAAQLFSSSHLKVHFANVTTMRGRVMNFRAQAHENSHR